ncbi:hypothetical protein EC988_005384 [Linderina pennispora]|nr:hypothetical protein EC988_005384 [Linderina pennispora]
MGDAGASTAGAEDHPADAEAPPAPDADALVSGTTDLIGNLLGQVPPSDASADDVTTATVPEALATGSAPLSAAEAASTEAPAADGNQTPIASDEAPAAESPAAIDALQTEAAALPSGDSSVVSSAPDAIDNLFGASPAGNSSEASADTATAPTPAPAAEDTAAAVQTINILSATNDDALEASIDAVIHSVIGDYKTESVPKAAVGFALIHPRREVVVMGERI